MKLGGYVLLAILAVVCLEETTAGKDVNASSCEALNHLREAVTSFQDTVTEMQATVNNQSDVLSNILATLEEVQETCLDNIHRMTSSQKYSLRVDLEASNGSTAYAEYREFSDAMIGTIRSSNLNNMLFSTPEYDHDRWFHVRVSGKNKTQYIEEIPAFHVSK
nr:hypothetical protein BaRGS_008901 [Batillaria attramentaria]